MHRRSNCTTFFVGLLFVAGLLAEPRCVRAQAPVQVPSQVPDLSHDADPVASPDGAAPAVVAPKAAEQDNSVSKENGKFVIHADAYEVRPERFGVR